ncbi:Uncharacterised protein [Yersinia frederiksenii]|nr:Uncharacterised protein [Yersinia frederiksenii]
MTVFHRGTQRISGTIISHGSAGDSKVCRRNDRGGFIGNKGRVLRRGGIGPDGGRDRVIASYQTHQIGCRHAVVVGNYRQTGLNTTRKGRPAGYRKSDADVRHGIAPGIFHCAT